MQKHVSPTEYRQQLRERILDAASKEFAAHGVKSVKMDDIANALSISKRTLYEIYTNKEELLMETIKRQMEHTNEEMRRYCAEDHNEIDIIMHYYQWDLKALSDVSPSYFADLGKYPQVVEWFQQRQEKDKQGRRIFFEQGIANGYFRADVDYPLISEIAESTKNYIMDNAVYHRYSLPHIFRNVVLFYVRGFCTPKGIEELDKKLDELPD